MRKIKNYLLALLTSCFVIAVFMSLLPPPERAFAEPSPNATEAGHGTHLCNSAAPLDPIDGILTQSGRPLTEVSIGNFSATPVFILSRNGNPTVDGWPLCNDAALCVSTSISLPLYGAMVSCAPAAGSVTVRVFGVR